MGMFGNAGLESRALFNPLGIEEGWQPAGNYGRNDFLVHQGSQPQPWGATQAEARSAPPASLLGPLITDDPTFQNRFGRLEAGALSAIDSLGFGMPMAVAHRMAPEKARSLQDFLNQYRGSNLLASIAAGAANPANTIYRAAGNTLAAKGYGLGSQAAADGVTMLGIGAAQSAIKNGGITSEAGLTTPAATAMTARYLMPKLPNSILTRIAGGAASGALGSVPEATYQGDFSRIPIGAAVGALYGSQLRPRPRDTRGLLSRTDGDIVDRSINAALISGAPVMAGSIYGVAKNMSEQDERPWSVHNDYGYQRGE